MAFGFPPSYEIEIDLLGDRQAARDAVVYAFEVLEWNYQTTDPDRFRATVPFGASSWGENFSVSLEVGTVALRSVCRSPLPAFDWGKNKQNVERFLVHFSQKEMRQLKTGSSEPAYLDEAGNTPLERVLSQESEKS